MTDCVSGISRHFESEWLWNEERHSTSSLATARHLPGQKWKYFRPSTVRLAAQRGIPSSAHGFLTALETFSTKRSNF